MDAGTGGAISIDPTLNSVEYVFDHKGRLIGIAFRPLPEPPVKLEHFFAPSGALIASVYRA